MTVETMGLKGEDLIHAQIVQWARQHEKVEPRLGMLFHPANGGARSPVAGMKMKMLGVKPGVPDLALNVKGSGFIGLWLEVKDGTKGVVSPAQKLWHEALTAQGHLVLVVRDAEAGIKALKDYLGMI